MQTRNRAPPLLADTGPARAGAGAGGGAWTQPDPPSATAQSQEDMAEVPPLGNKVSPSCSIEGGCGGDPEQEEEGCQGSRAALRRWWDAPSLPDHPHPHLVG